MHCRGLLLFPEPAKFLHILAFCFSYFKLRIYYSKPRGSIKDASLQTGILLRIGFRNREVPARFPDVPKMEPRRKILCLPALHRQIFDVALMSFTWSPFLSATTFWLPVKGSAPCESKKLHVTFDTWVEES